MKEDSIDIFRPRVICVPIAGLIVLLVLIVGAWCAVRPDPYSLPTVEDIEAIRVISLVDGMGQDAGSFTVEPRDCRPLLELLGQSTLEKTPLKWGVLCRMRLQAKGNRVPLITIYQTGHGLPIAYSVDPSGTYDRASRRYYRGGNQDRVVAALVEIWKKAVEQHRTHARFDPGFLGDNEVDITNKIRAKQTKVP